MRNLFLILFWMYWLLFIPQELIWVRLRLSITSFSLWTNYYFLIDAFYFINNAIVYKAFLIKEKDGKVVYEIFIVNVVSMHLSATWQFPPFQRPWTRISLGLMDWATVRGLAQMGENPRSGGEQEWSKVFGHHVIHTRLCFNSLLTHYMLLVSFYTPCKNKKFDAFRGYRKGLVAVNRLK